MSQCPSKAGNNTHDYYTLTEWPPYNNIDQGTRLHGLDIVVIRTVVPYYEYHDIRRDTIESTRKVEQRKF